MLERPFSPALEEAEIEAEDLSDADHAAIRRVAFLLGVAGQALRPTGLVFDEEQAGPKDMTPRKAIWLVDECVASESDRLGYGPVERARLGQLVRQVLCINGFSIADLEKSVVVTPSRTPG
jgi:hypothetical protein